MPRKRTETPAEPIVTFEVENRTYQIDAIQRKVYRRFVEIETAKAAEIFSLWRSSMAGA